jgi:MFS family permease
MRSILATFRQAYSGLPRNAWLLSLVQFNRSHEGNRGRHMGLFGVSFSLAWMMGPTAGAAIYARFPPLALWLGCGGLGMILALGFKRLASRRPTLPPDSGGTTKN